MEMKGDGLVCTREKIFLTKGLIWREELKRFLVKRGFSSAATNPSCPLHLLEHHTFFVQNFSTLKIQLRICQLEKLIWNFALFIRMLFEGGKVFYLPFNRVNWPQGDFRNLSHSPNTGFHLCPNWD